MNQVKKNAVVVAYQKLSNAFNECSVAVQEYAEQFKGTEDLAASLALLAAAPAIGAAFGASANGNEPTVKGKGKRSEHDELAATDAEGPSTTKKAKKEKKIIDPDAPKRPPSTFLDYQNDVRAAFRAANPDLHYTEIMKLMSAAWASLDPVAKQKYADATATRVAAFEIEKQAYDDAIIIKAGGIPDPNPPAKRRLPKDAVAGADVKVDTPAKESKKDKAAAPTPVVAPTPVKKVKASKVAPAAAAVADASSEESSDDASDDDSDSDEEGVIQQVVVPKASTSKVPATKKKAAVAPAKKEKKVKA